jgi:hypothetical protein
VGKVTEKGEGEKGEGEKGRRGENFAYVDVFVIQKSLAGIFP